MPPSKKEIDGRTKRSRGTTERVSLDMAGRVLTLWRWTDKANNSGRNWNVRCRFEARVFQKSTKEEDIKRAREFAISWYAGIITRRSQGIPMENEPQKFSVVAQSFLNRCERLVQQKKRHPTHAKDARIRYKNYLHEFFKNNYVYEITTPRINSWMKWREEYRLHSKELRSGELKKELTLLKSILNEAVSEGLLDRLPDFPPAIRVETISSKKPPARTYFNSKEYSKLLEVSKKRIKEAKELVENPPPKGGNYPKIYRDRMYLHHYIIFLAGTGLRPGEAQRIRAKDITMVKGDTYDKCHLVINTVGKRSDRKVVSKYSAYFAYQNLQRDVRQNLQPDDIVFPVSPHSGLRTLLTEAGLRTNSRGETRDAKSLRHYYIMKALADGHDIWILSVQCDVSPDIIKKHYARHMTSQQFKDDLIKVSQIDLL